MIFQNTHVITGNLGGDAKLDVTGTGKTVVRLRVATEYRSSYQGEQRVTTTWHGVAVWGVLAERIAHWKQGDLVHIEGPVFEREIKSTEPGRKTRVIRELYADIAYRIDMGQLDTPPNRERALPAQEVMPRAAGGQDDWPT